MASRLDVRPLVRGVLAGLRHRRDLQEEESPDWPTRIVLVAIPAAVIAAMLLFHVTLGVPDQLLAGAALLAGALLTGFSQVAAWRERILTRDEQARTRALDEAAAHILGSLLISVLITVLVVALAVLPTLGISSLLLAVRAVFGAVAVGALAYVGLTLVIVANLLWDAFQLEKKDAVLDELEDLPDEDL